MLHGYLVPHPPLIVPGIGDGSEIPDTRKAMETVASEIASYNADTVIIISPHSIMYSDYIHIAPGESASGDFGAFRAKEIQFQVTYDSELASLIGSEASGIGLFAGTQGEQNPELDHGILVPAYFIKPKQIVRISLSGLSLIDHYRLGMCIAKATKKLSRNVVIVASGDMSHKLKADGPYGYAPEGPKFDQFIRDCVQPVDFKKLMAVDLELADAAAECGLRSLVMLAGAFDGYSAIGKILSYEGPYGVGYLTASFSGEDGAKSLLLEIERQKRDDLDTLRRNEDPFVRLARQNIEHYAKVFRKMELPDGLPDELLHRRAGVFVTIKKDGALRGCIGTIEPTEENIAEEILRNSIQSAFHDPRFDPVVAEELDDLTYSVDVLSPTEKIRSKTDLDVNRYGVIVSYGYKRGLLLPNLEGVDSVEEQVSIALQKGGISLKDPYEMERFEVVRHR